MLKRAKFAIIATCLLATSALADAPQRVITIGGAVTEIAYLLGAEKQLVGSDTTSYYPPAAAQLPKVGYQRALSAEGILSLAPDLIILNEQAGPPPVLAQLRGANVPTLRLKASRNIDDIINNIKMIGNALNKKDKAKNLVRKMQKQNASLKKKTRNAKAPRVLVVHHHTSGAPTAAGLNTAANSIIALSGGVNVCDDFSNFRPLTPEAAVALAPEIIIIATPSAHRIKDKTALKRHRVFDATPASKAKRIYVMDALEVLGFGPRTIETALKLNALYQ